MNRNVQRMSSAATDLRPTTPKIDHRKQVSKKSVDDVEGKDEDDRKNENRLQ